MLQGCSVACQRRMANLSFDGSAELSRSAELSKILQAILAAIHWQLTLILASSYSLHICSL